MKGLHAMTRSTDPDTSRAAAIQALKLSGVIQRNILDLLERHPEGLLHEEICAKVGPIVALHTKSSMPPEDQSIRSRCNELGVGFSGLVIASGRKKKMSTGNKGTLWVCTSQFFWFTLRGLVSVDAPAELRHELNLVVAGSSLVSESMRREFQRYGQMRGTIGDQHMGLMKALLAKKQAGKLSKKEEEFLAAQEAANNPVDSYAPYVPGAQLTLDFNMDLLLPLDFGEEDDHDLPEN